MLYSSSRIYTKCTTYMDPNVKEREIVCLSRDTEKLF